jgi:hypothetical protein
MIKARPKYHTDLYCNIYIDNIQKAVVICLIIPTIFPFDAGKKSRNTTYRLGFWLCTLPTEVQCLAFHQNHMVWQTKIQSCSRNGNDSKQTYSKAICLYRRISMVTILRKILNLQVETKGFSWNSKDPPS